MDLNLLLPDAWITAYPEHILKYRRDEAEAVASARRRRRATRRAKTHEPALSPSWARRWFRGWRSEAPPSSGRPPGSSGLTDPE
ncbi:MAG TPA: hypothetical protein VKA15_03025, partial [Isosphaeraceae bacterium]|nr:hypothetical protein [Isosphaeraceae bacterium]